MLEIWTLPRSPVIEWKLGDPDPFIEINPGMIIKANGNELMAVLRCFDGIPKPKIVNMGRGFKWVGESAMHIALNINILI